jgi:hypothetical protein
MLHPTGRRVNSMRLPMHAGQPAKLRDLGYDEIWLQNWLASQPAGSA